MWNGVGPTVVRAMSLSSVSLAVTSESKQRLPQLVPILEKYPTLNVMVATLIASFFGTAASQPFDVVKSRMQNMVVPENGSPPYSGGISPFKGKPYLQADMGHAARHRCAAISLSLYIIIL